MGAEKPAQGGINKKIDRVKREPPIKIKIIGLHKTRWIKD
jgi:hypothetical protein